MKENCVNLEVVLANGKVVETAGYGARPRWNVADSKSGDFLSFAGKLLPATISLNFFSAAREHLE